MRFTEFDPAEEEIVLPYQGKEYRIASPAWEVGVAVQRYIEIGLKAAALGDAQDRGREVTPDMLLTDEEKDIANTWSDDRAGVALLGDTFDAMIADRVPQAVIKRAIFAAMTWSVTSDLDKAAQVWAGGANPKETRRKPMDRQSKQPSKSSSGSRKKTSTR